jgi:hypothetical protein
MADEKASCKRTHRLAYLPHDLVVRLEQRRASNKDMAIMANLGISDNTWRKIRTGLPIRASVANRLRMHLAPGQNESS